MKKLDIQNVFIDLDGTALKSNKTISKKTISIIKELNDKKINVFVATGRPPYMIKSELDLLNVNENVICVNGGIIINNINHDHEIINIKKIDSKSTEEIYKFLNLNKIPYLIYSDKNMYYDCDENNQWIRFLKNKINNLKQEHVWNLKKINNSFNINEHVVVKFLIPTFDLYKEEIIAKINQFLNDKKISCNIIESQENILDIIPSDSSKGLGIEYIANILSLNLDKSLAFGDADNDISMFKAVKYSVAMGNAVENLKKIATYITDNNDENGIYKFIKNNVL